MACGTAVDFPAAVSAVNTKNLLEEFLRVQQISSRYGIIGRFCIAHYFTYFFSKSSTAKGLSKSLASVATFASGQGTIPKVMSVALIEPFEMTATLNAVVSTSSTTAIQTYWTVLQSESDF